MDQHVQNNSNYDSKYEFFLDQGDRACKSGDYTKGKSWYQKGYQFAKEQNNSVQVTIFEWLCFSCIG